MNNQMQIERLEKAGVAVKAWEGANETRLYLSQGGRDIGYITEEDDGTTGTCRHVTRRSGWVAGILRG